MILVLRFWIWPPAFGVESDVAGGVSSRKFGLNDAGFFVGNLKVAEVEGENAGAAKLACGRFCARVTAPMSVGHPQELAIVWSGLKMGSATVALIASPSLEVSELSGSSRLAWTIQLPASVFAGSARGGGSSQK